MKNNRQGGKTANNIRECFASYFMSENGKLPWQNYKI